MASTYSNLKIQLMATGENTTTWGDVTNINLGTALEEAITGSADVSFSSADVTLTLSNTNASQTARNLRLNLTGTSGGARFLYLSLPSAAFPTTLNIEKAYIINNGLADAVTVRNKINSIAAGASVVVPAGKTMWVYNTGTDIVDVTTYLSSLTLGSALSVASGGTGATTFTANALLKGAGASALSSSVMYENGGYVGINVTGPVKLLDGQETYNGEGGFSYVNLSTGASSAGSVTVEAGGSYFYHKVTRATGVVQFRGVTATTLNQDFNTQVFRSTAGVEYARFSGSGLTVAGTIETTSGGVKYPDATTQTTGVLEKVDVYTTTGSATWTKPSWAKSVEVILFGGGGGGASGRKGAVGSNRSGGTGGGGGSYSQVTFQASALSATETVIVGAGGAGGAAQTTNSTNGNAGTNGGDSSFGGKIYAPGGLGGAAGTTGAGAQVQTRGTFYGGAPGSTNTSLGGAAGVGITTGPGGFAGGAYGGGSGGGITYVDAASGGGQGVNTTSGTAPSWKVGGTQVVPANNAVTGNGNSGTNNTNIWLGGESGDGGSASTSGNAYSGGNGGTWGGGGGGGGAGTDNVGNSGAGGTGGNGIVVVISRG